MNVQSLFPPHQKFRRLSPDHAQSSAPLLDELTSLLVKLALLQQVELVLLQQVQQVEWQQQLLCFSLVPLQD